MKVAFNTNDETSLMYVIFFVVVIKEKLSFFQILFQTVNDKFQDASGSEIIPCGGMEQKD